MIKTFILISLIILTAHIAFCQKDLLLYKKIYQAGDSLNISTKIGVLNKSVFTIANNLDKQHPASYFQESAQLLNESKYNEAGFLYYVGYMRFKYYNSSNPSYEPSGDGALFASLKSVIGRPVNVYLRINVDNFIQILKLSINYCQENNFEFYSKEKNIDKYNTQIIQLLELLADLEKNKIKHSEDWINERKEMEKNIDTAIEKYKIEENPVHKNVKNKR